MKISLSKASPVLWFALGALVVGGTGTAYAATGGTFRLGKSNVATSTTSLSNTAGIALSLRSKSGKAPLTVGTNRVKVANLNSDLIDGRDSTYFQKRVSSTCATGSTIKAVSASGTVTCSGATYVAVVNGDGSLARGSTGVSSTTTGTGSYEVTFPTDIQGCAYFGSSSTSTAGFSGPTIVQTAWTIGFPHTVTINTFYLNTTSYDNVGFHLLVSCP